MLKPTSPAFVALRRMLRATGLAGPIAAMLGRGGYEQRFNASLEASVRSGDCVWDVGANVGYYTTRFAAACGAAGHVFAFEPSPANVARLREATAGLGNVTTLELGLSDHDGSAAFKQGEDDLGATSHVVAGAANADAGASSVRLATGAGLLAQVEARAPNVLKIDVEGHELEVLRGLVDELTRPGLRDVFIEVHFGILDEAGRSDVPSTIVALLERSGFRVAWVDPSHLHAGRGETVG